MAGSPTVVSPMPAWAESNDGFLASGWSAEGADEPQGKSKRGRRKSAPRGDELAGAQTGGRARVALLSVAAVAVVLGGTVAGVKMMGASAECKQGSCAAVQQSGNNGQPAPSVSDPGPGEGEPDEEAVEEEPEEATPSESKRPTPTYSARAPRRTPTPKPSPTRTKQRPTTQPTEEEEPTPQSTVTEEPTEEPTSTAEPSSGTFPTDAGVPNPQNTQSSGVRQAPGAGGSVNVKFDVTKQGFTGYKANVEVVNSSPETMGSLTLSLPVSGRVTDVDGAGWTQDGQLLIIDVSQSLATGATVSVTFTATGKGQAPESCGLVGGECSLS
ncbi:cellulose binding domain-containing protein [Nonomuraea sp. NPDC050790]|uniref:cellulose binding domain-containing protein n=1 Tax=Nonomuraea sp. NPDC050790 TaxID=3364371 RepID=UPI00378DFC9B